MGAGSGVGEVCQRGIREGGRGHDISCHDAMTAMHSKADVMKVRHESLPSRAYIFFLISAGAVSMARKNCSCIKPAFWNSLIRDEK